MPENTTKTAIFLNVDGKSEKKIENQNSQVVWWHPMIAGWGSGTTGGYACYIFEQAKKRAESGQIQHIYNMNLTFLGKIKESYRGANSFALTLAPVSMIQVTLNNHFASILSKDTSNSYPKYAAGLFSGAMGAFVSAPVEHLVLVQQTEKCKFREAAKILSKKGYFYAWTGLKPLLCREAVFGFTMLTGASSFGGWLSNYYQRDLNLIGEIAVGVGGAAISHPFDLMATRKQMTYSEGKRALLMREVFKEVMREKGWKGFFSGYSHRVFLFTGCMLIIGNLEKYIQKILKQGEQKPPASPASESNQKLLPPASESNQKLLPPAPSEIETKALLFQYTKKHRGVENIVIKEETNQVFPQFRHSPRQ